MTLVDTSAWIEFVRGGRKNVRERLRELVRAGAAAVTEPIAMELLAGARNEAHACALANMLAGTTAIRVEGLADWEVAAGIYRTCRAQGKTIRSQLDCLIAAIAIREDVEVLHADRDFDLIAEHTPLRIAA